MGGGGVVSSGGPHVVPGSVAFEFLNVMVDPSR